MIIFRYFAKNILVSMSAVTAILLLIIMSGRFIKYLAQAAAGDLGADVLFTIIAYRMPGFLELILPLGFFIGILLSYGRLYLDSEMTVLSACGMSFRRLVFYTLIPAVLVAVLVAVLSLLVSPWGAAKVDSIFRNQDARTEFDALTPGRFQELGSGNRVTYTESLSKDRKRMSHVFIFQRDTDSRGRESDPVLLVAETGSQYIDPDTGSHFLLLENGYRFDGLPGELDYRVTAYEQYGAKIPRPQQSTRRLKSEAKSTAMLRQSDSLEDQAQLQWRFALPFLVPIVALIAVPLSRVNPRQGRYLRLLPAIFLYMGYLVILSAARSSIEDGELPPEWGLWSVHLVFLLIALALVANVHRNLPWLKN